MPCTWQILIFFITEYLDKSQELLVGKTPSLIPPKRDKAKEKYFISVQEDGVTTQKFKNKIKKQLQGKFYNLFLANHASR